MFFTSVIFVSSTKYSLYYRHREAFANIFLSSCLVVFSCHLDYIRWVHPDVWASWEERNGRQGHCYFHGGREDESSCGQTAPQGTVNKAASVLFFNLSMSSSYIFFLNATAGHQSHTSVLSTYSSATRNRPSVTSMKHISSPSITENKFELLNGNSQKWLLSCSLDGSSGHLVFHQKLDNTQPQGSQRRSPSLFCLWFDTLIAAINM